MQQSQDFTFDDSHSPKMQNPENSETFVALNSTHSAVAPGIGTADGDRLYSHDRNQSLPNTTLSREDSYTAAVSGRPTRAATFSRAAVYRSPSQQKYQAAPVATVVGGGANGNLQQHSRAPSLNSSGATLYATSGAASNGGSPPVPLPLNRERQYSASTQPPLPDQVIAAGTAFEILSPISPVSSQIQLPVQQPQHMLIRGNSHSVSPPAASPPVVGLGVGVMVDPSHPTTAGHQYSGSIAIPSLQSIQARIPDNGSTLAQRSVSGPATIAATSNPSHSNPRAKSSEPKTPSEYALHILFTQVSRNKQTVT